MSEYAEPVTLFLCSTCRAQNETGALEQALAIANLPVRLRAHPCLNACNNPTTLAMQAPDKATYVFSGVDPEKDASDIVATLELYLESPGGWIMDARRCGRLRHCLIARLPALSSEV